MNSIANNYGYESSSEDSEREEESVSDQRKEPRSTKHDYFGLQSSYDSCDNDEVSVPCYTDTLINAFELKADVFGPNVEIKAHAETQRFVSKTKQPRTTISYLDENKRSKLLNPTSAVEESVSASKDIRSFELSEPHSLMYKYSCRSGLSSSTPQRRNRRSVTRHSSCVNALQWGPQLNSHHLLLSASMDGSIKIQDVITKSSNTLLYSNGAVHAGSAVRCARWHRQRQNVIVSGGFDRNAIVTDVTRGVELQRYCHDSYVNCVKIHPEQTDLFLTGSCGLVSCWDLRIGADHPPVKEFKGNFDDVKDIEFLPSGNEFVCCSTLVTRDSADRNIVAWDLATAAILSNQIFQERYHCTCLKVRPDGKKFLAQTNGDYIASFSTLRPYKMNTKLRYEGHKVEGYWVGCDVSVDGEFVYSGSADGYVYVYSAHTGNVCVRLRVSKEPCLLVEVHPLLPSTIATATYHGHIHVFH